MRRRSTSHADTVESALRRAILASQFKPGERLAAESLAVLYGVSPTPVREAFARLAAQGLVTYQAQRGVRVAPFSLEEMEEIYEVRSLLEPLAIERSVGFADESARADVKQAYEQMLARGGQDVRALDAREYEAYEEAHAAFHAATLNHCGSSWLIRLSRLLNDHSLRYRQASIGLRERYEPIAAEHAKILDAFLAGAAARARLAHYEHLENTRRAVRDLVSKDDVSSSTP